MEILLIFYQKYMLSLTQKEIMYNLSEQELQILNFLKDGDINIEIANKMCLSRHTVKAHISAIIKKLNAKNRTNAVYIASKNNII